MKNVNRTVGTLSLSLLGGDTTEAELELVIKESRSRLRIKLTGEEMAKLVGGRSVSGMLVEVVGADVIWKRKQVCAHLLPLSLRPLELLEAAKLEGDWQVARDDRHDPRAQVTDLNGKRCGKVHFARWVEEGDEDI